jgi:hypothetical protein
MLLFREGRYKVHKTRGVNLIGYELAQTPELAGFALYVGNVIHGRSQLEAYFTKDSSMPLMPTYDSADSAGHA